MGRRKFSFKMYVYLIKETNKRHVYDDREYCDGMWPVISNAGRQTIRRYRAARPSAPIASDRTRNRKLTAETRPIRTNLIAFYDEFCRVFLPKLEWTIDDEGSLLMTLVVEVTDWSLPQLLSATEFFGCIALENRSRNVNASSGAAIVGVVGVPPPKKKIQRVSVTVSVPVHPSAPARLVRVEDSSGRLR